MNISKHFTKRFRLNFTLNQSSQNPEQHTYRTYFGNSLSPSRRREAPCEGTNPPRLFTPGETKALAESKVHQISRAWVTVRVSVGGHPH